METNVERIIREARETREALGIKPRISNLELNKQVQADLWNTEVARRGGLSKSPAKQRAARRNGRLGGRPSKP